MFRIGICVLLFSPFTLGLSLFEALDKAERYNENLLQNKEDIAVAAGRAKQVLSAVLPIMDASGVLTEQLGASAKIKFPIFNLPGILSTQSAYKQLRATEVSYERKRETLIFNVATAYLDALLERKLLDLAREQHKLSEIKLFSQQRKADLKEISRLDLERAKLLVAKTAVQIAKQEASFKIALNALVVYLGDNKIPELEEFAGCLEVENSSLLQNRFDLKAHALSVQAQWLTEKSAFWLYAPSLQVSTGWLFPLDKPIKFEASLSLVVPLYDGGSRYGIQQVSTASLRQSKLRLHLLEREIALEVQNAFLATERQKKLHAIQIELLGISQAAVKSAENRYAIGQASSLDLLDEQTRLFEAQVDLLKALFELHKARVTLSYRLGNPKEGLLSGG